MGDYPCANGTYLLQATARYLYGVVPQGDHTLIWRRLNPANLVRLDQPRLGFGQFQATLHGTPGNRVVIATSLDLAHWQPILTNTLQEAAWTFQSPIGSEPARYYRAEVVGQ